MKKGAVPKWHSPLNLKKMVISVDAGVRPVVLIPRIQAGGSHGRSIELPNDKACYQL